jgi:thymidine phosphorylase
LAVVGLKGGRTANGQQIDHSVGFDRILPIGTLVNRGDVVARVHARDESAALLASLQYQGALVIDNKQAEQQPVIYQTISA